MDSLTPNTTDHKATEEALRESRESFKALAENANDGILIATEGGAHTYANRRAGEITGYSVAELLKTSIQDLAVPDEVQNIMERFRKRISGEDIPKQSETVIIRKDGKSVPIEITSAKTIWHGQPAIMVIIRDITERKRAEEALKESENKFRLIFEKAPIGITHFDMNGVITSCNASLAGILGVPLEKIIGFDMKTGIKDIQSKAAIQEVLSGRIAYFEGKYVSLTGGKCSIIKNIYTPLFSEDGSLAGGICITEDITERKRAEEALRESEAKYRLIADNTADSIWIFDMDMHLQYISPSVKKMKGFTVEETLSQSLEEMMTPASLESLMKRFDQEMVLEASGTADPGRTVSFETEEYCKSGATILVENSVTFIRDAQGRPVRMLGISRDITERKRAEEVLRESEEKFRNLFRNAVEGILVADVDTGKFLLANPAICRMLGYMEKELTLMGIADIHPEKELNYIVKEFGSIMQGNKHFSDSIPCLRKDGSILYADISGFPQVIDGKKCTIGFFSDVTERKQMEEALRESQKRFQALTETTSDFVWEMDANGVYTYCSPQIKELWGYKPEDMIGRTPFDVMIPKDREHAIQMFRTISESQRSFKGMETSSWDNTGRIVVLETSGVPFFDIDGRLCGYRGISRDITERKRAEEELRLAQEKYTKAFLLAPDAITISELDSGRFVEVNEAATTIFGYSREELIGKSALELGIWSKKEDRDTFIDQIREHGKICYYEITERRKSGALYNASITADTITIGNLRYLIAIIRDVTERKQMEEALRESEERYRILTDAAHDVIYTLTPEGVVTFVNSGGSALIGMPPEKIVGLSLESLYHADITQELRENLDKVISTKRPVRFDSKFWRENRDQVTWLDAQLVPQFGPDGSVVQVIGISRSITDRKQAEILLKRFNSELELQVRSRTIDLERLNTMLEAEVIQRTMAEDSIRNSLNERELLLREIHHRVRNNLQIILSLINLQSRNIKDPNLLNTMGDFQNRIKAMAHVHERMCLVDDIARIDLSEIVTFLGTSLFRSYKVDPQHIRLNVEMKDLHITIDSAIPLSLIINELISNSIKHAFPKGIPGEITIMGRRETDTLVLSVRDTGIGMPKDFDWMSSNKSIGHRLVVSLVEQLQGTIELDRTAGTAFNIVVKEK
jgi:PAS domain S-box-containing protein